VGYFPQIISLQFAEKELCPSFRACLAGEESLWVRRQARVVSLPQGGIGMTTFQVFRKWLRAKVKAIECSDGSFPGDIENEILDGFSDPDF
jgi:hypothetical protein